MPKHVFYTGHDPRYCLVQLGALIKDEIHPNAERAERGERKYTYHAAHGPRDDTSSLNHVVLDVDSPDDAVMRFQKYYKDNQGPILELQEQLMNQRKALHHGALQLVKEQEAFGDG